MRQRRIHLAAAIAILCAISSVNGATLESPKAGKVFKLGERVACAGKCVPADLAIVVAFKDKKGVVIQSAATGIDGDTWTIVLDPPRGGWPAGEMTLELISGPKGKTQDSAKITFER